MAPRNLDGGVVRSLIRYARSATSDLIPEEWRRLPKVKWLFWSSAAHPPELISVRGHHVLADLLNKDSTVVDLGAHLGQFSSEISMRFGCRCYGAEPNPGLWKLIPQTNHVRTLNRAVAATTGPMLFEVSSNPEGSHLRLGNHPEGNVISIEAVTLADFMRLCGITRIDLLKIDIEGAELELFDSLSDDFLRDIGQITVEFHDFIPALACGPAVARAKDRLAALGFAAIVFSKNSNSDVLFLNRRAYNGTPLHWFYLENLARYTRGLARIAGRWMGNTGG